MANVAARRQPIRGPLSILCEGTHDAAFLFALLRGRHIEPDPDFPFFRRTDRGFEQLAGQAYGDGALAAMLRSVAADLDTDPFVAERLRGVVVVCDAGERPSTSLRRIRRAAESAGFVAPTKPGVWGGRTEPRPNVAIVLVPGPDRPGGLETLCRDYLAATNPDISGCVDEFFRCVPAFEPPRSAEKRDKAAFVCAAAALERDEPSITLARAFSGRRPLVDVSHTVFDEIGTTLRHLLGHTPGPASGQQCV